MKEIIGSGIGAVSALIGRGESWFLDRKHAVYGASLARIIYGFVVVVFVIANFSARDYIWGASSAWVQPIQHLSAWAFPFDFYSSSDPEWLFTLKFLLLGSAGLSLMVGWHARVSAIVVLFLYVSLVTTNPVATDQTDNAFRIILFYFCFTDLSAKWSFDARRREKRAGKHPMARSVVPGWLPTAIHNAGIIAVALQVFLIYVVAGLSKVQGSQWQDGTAVYYPLRLDAFGVWPGLNDLLVANGVLINIVTYVAVFVQLFFPFLMLQRWTRIAALICILGMHAGIGIFMGLPLFSLSMMAADTIFIRDSTYAKVEGAVRERFWPWVRQRFSKQSQNLS